MTGGKQRMPGRAVSVFLSVALVAFVMPLDARAGYIDQQNLPSWTWSGYLDVSQATGQEFVPAVSEHLAVELGFWPVQYGDAPQTEPGQPVGIKPILDPAQPVNITLRIRHGAMDGTVVDGTEVIQTFLPDAAYRDPFQVPQWVQFAFEQPVMLNPSQLYVIEVHADGPAYWWIDTLFVLTNPGNLPPLLIDRYLDGRAIIAGTADETKDFLFRTIVASDPSGQVVPEPAGLTLLGLTAVTLFFGRRGLRLTY